MCTYVFHFDTAQIHQGSCTALGDFLLKEEPHYAIEEVPSKNTCGDLLLPASPQRQLKRLCSALLLQLLRAHGTYLPFLPTRLSRFSLSVFTSPLTWRVMQGTCQNHWEAAGSGLLLGFMQSRDRLAGSSTPKSIQIWAGLKCGAARVWFSL